VDVAVSGADTFGLDPALVRAAVVHTLSADGVTKGEVSVAVLGDEAIQELNRVHLRHDWPTDVLSFDLSDGDSTDLVGDLYIGGARARAQAEEHGVSYHEEIVRLIVHGTLHLLGYDHPSEERESSEFFARQERLVVGLIDTAPTRGA